MALDSKLLEPPSVGVGNKGKLEEDDDARTASSDCGDDSVRQASDEDLEDGELEDDDQDDTAAGTGAEEVPASENPAPDEPAEPVVNSAPQPSGPAVIPSLLDLKLSPPRNGGFMAGRKSNRWQRKPFNRKRYVGPEYGDSGDEEVDEARRPRKRRHDEKGGKVRYVDHDGNYDEIEAADYSDVAWFGSSQNKSGRPTDNGPASPPGPYDSPYSSPPGPYDSPSATDDEDSKPVRPTEQVAPKAAPVPATPVRSQAERTKEEEDHESPAEIGESTPSPVASPVAVDPSEKQRSKSRSPPASEDVKSSTPELSAGDARPSRKNAPPDGRRLEREGRGYDREGRGYDRNNRSKPATASMSSTSVSRRSGSPDQPHPKKRRLVDTPWDERPVCRFYMEGKCTKGSDCQFNHVGPQIKKPELCRHYSKHGHCSRGQDCNFHHETWPCPSYHRTNHCADGDDCIFSHEELTDETRVLIENRTFHEKKIVVVKDEPMNDDGDATTRDFQSQLPSQSASTESSKSKIPSLFDIDVPIPPPRPQLPPGANRQMGPRGFPMKPPTGRYPMNGPRMRMPPRHVMMQLIRQQISNMQRPRHGSGRGAPFRFPPMFGENFGFDSNMPWCDDGADDHDNEDWNEHSEESDHHRNADDDSDVTAPTSLPPAVESETRHPVKQERSSEVIIIKTETEMDTAPSTSSAAISSASYSDSESVSNSGSYSDNSFTTKTVQSFANLTQEPTVSSASAPLIVAGVDLTHLPPIQRDLFLRLHQQQRNNAVPEEPPSVAPISTSQPAFETTVTRMLESSPTSSVNVSASTSSPANNMLVSDILKVLVQQPPPQSNMPRLPIAPVFNINQVLSAITQLPSSTTASTGLAKPREPTDAELEMNGCRTQIVYTVQPYDCLCGVVIPLGMNINDPIWDEDPRILHWRREDQLGRAPRREVRPKPVVVEPPKPVESIPVKRVDPRRRNEPPPAAPTVQPAQPMNEMQQQMHIQQMVQQMINNNAQQQQQQRPVGVGFAPQMMQPMPGPPMMPGNIRLPQNMPNDVRSVPQGFHGGDVRAGPPGFPGDGRSIMPGFPGMTPMPAGMPVHPMMGMPSMYPPMFNPSFNPSMMPPFMGNPGMMASGVPNQPFVAQVTAPGTVVTSAVSIVAPPSSSIAPSQPESLNKPIQSPPRPIESNSPPQRDDCTTTESKSTMLPPKSAVVDYSRFKKRKVNQSPDGKSNSASSQVGTRSTTTASTKTSESPSDVIALTSDAGRDKEKDVLLFQSPLVGRSSSTAASGYNRPPNNRYLELVEQNGQYQRDRRAPKTDSAPAKKTGYVAHRPTDVASAMPAPAAAPTFPEPRFSSLMSMNFDSPMNETAPEGSIKDMFKTIDPTASPFC